MRGKLGLALLAGAALTAPGARADLAFFPPAGYTTDAGTQAAAVGDVDGDGVADIVTANAAGNDVSVLLGNGDGSFGSAQNFTTGATSSPSAVVLAGFRTFGTPLDIVSTSSAPTGVVRLTNQSHPGVASFGAPKRYTTSFGVAGLIAPYLQEFPPQQLVAVGGGASTGTVGVWEASACGQGDPCNGTLGGPYTYAAGPNPESVAADDFNGFGFLDLAVVNPLQPAGTVRVLINNSNDGFSTQGPVLTVGSFPVSVVTGDFNGDGKPDIAVANFLDDTVSVLLNTTPSSGTPISFAPQAVFAVGSNPNAIAAADLNMDGKTDLVTANQDGTLSILLGNGDGTFGPARSVKLGQDSLTSITVADLNGDGAPDLLATDPAGSVEVLLAAPLPALSPASISFPAGDVSSPGATRTLTISNRGTGALRVSQFGIVGADGPDFSVVSDTCSSSVQLHGSCKLGVRFTAGAVGRRTATLQITDNASGSPRSIALSGLGTSPTGPTIQRFTVATTRRHRTQASIRVSEPGTAVLMLVQRQSGRRQGRRCVPAATAPRKRRCTVLETIKTLRVRIGAGVTRVPIAGRLQRGSYTVTLRVTGATGHRSAPASASFTITR